MPIPYTNNQLMLEDGLYTPSTLKGRNNFAFIFWKQILYQALNSVLVHENLPEQWNTVAATNLLNKALILSGKIFVSKDNEHGLWFNPCTVSGFNFYYQPTVAMVSNPLLGKKEYFIPDDGVLVNVLDSYTGLCDIINYYAEMLAYNDVAIKVAINNSKQTHVFGAKNKAAADTIKKLKDKADSGEACVVYDVAVNDMGKAHNYENPFNYIKMFSRNDFVLDLLQEEHMSLLDDFYTLIGIPTLPYEKKERMVTSEADSRKVVSQAQLSVWLNNINEGWKRVHNMYPEYPLIVTKSAYEMEGGSEDGTGNINNAGNREMAEE